MKFGLLNRRRLKRGATSEICGSVEILVKLKAKQEQEQEQLMKMVAKLFLTIGSTKLQRSIPARTAFVC